MINTITSKDNKNVKFAISLKESKNQKQHHKFLGESIKSLELALKANLVTDVFTYEYLDLPETINQYLVSEDVMKKLSNTKNPEGVVFISKMPEFKKDNLNKIVYLEEINDPGNLGTIIRTALAFDIDAVVVSKNSVSIYNPKTLAACKGANYLIPVFEDELDNIMDGHDIVATALEEDALYDYQLMPLEKFILVMGNEAHGISQKTLQKANHTVIIPIKNIDSLNVAVATGIMLDRLTH